MKANKNPNPVAPEAKEPLRLLALSDGLFATVLTLLVLDLRIPEALGADGGSPTSFLRSLGPHLFSYLLTFLVAGSYWTGHHRDFDHVVRYDRSLLGYNLLFLLFMGLFPFTTATISVDHYRSSDFPFYWTIYATNIILAGLMLGLTWAYAVSHQLVTPEGKRQSRHIAVHQLVTPAIFLVSILVEFVFPQAFLGPYTLLLIPLGIWVVDRRFAVPQVHGHVHTNWTERLWRAGTMLPWLLIIGVSIWSMTL